MSSNLFAIIERQCAEMQTAADAAVELTLQRGADMYVRERHLAGILGDLSIYYIPPHEPSRTERVLELLDQQIDSHRAAITGRHRNADRNGLIAALQARRAEAATLDRLNKDLADHLDRIAADGDERRAAVAAKLWTEAAQ